MNGQQVNSLNGTQSSMLPTLPQDNFASLVKAMSAWAASSTSSQTSSSQVSQVQIWNAVS